MSALRQFATRNPSKRIDLLAASAAAGFVLIAFFEVVALGDTLSTSASVPGANGFGPVSGQPTPDPDDQSFRLDRGASAWQFEPWAEVNARAITRGDLPLWNPFQGAGTPHAANMQSAALDPLLLPVNTHPTPRTWDLTLVATYALGAVAAFAFGRRIGMSPAAALVTATAFSLSGYFFLYSNNHFIRSFVYLPILYLAVDWVIRSRGILPIGALGIAVAGNLLTGMPEFSVLVLAAGALYGAFRTLVRRHPEWRAMTRLVGGFVVGFLLAAPALLLLAQYTPIAFSNRDTHIRGIAFDSVRTALNWVVPYFSGQPIGNALDGGYSGARGWAGAGAIALALAGLASHRTARRLSAGAVAAVTAVACAKVFGVPLLNDIGRLPAIEVVDFTFSTPPVIAFGIAVLAGIGTQALLDSDVEPRRFAALAAVFLVVVVWLALRADNRVFLEATSLKHTLGQFGIAVAAGIAIAALVVLGRRTPLIATGAFAVVAVELLLLAPWGIYSPRYEPFAKPPWVRHVQAATSATKPVRIFGLDAKLFPNTASAFQLQDLRVLDALYVERYLEYLRTFIEPSVFDRFVGGPHASGEREPSDFLRNPMFQLLGVEYIIAGGARTIPAPISITPLMTDTLAASGRGAASRSVITIGQDTRDVILQNPASSTILPTPPPDGTDLSFSYAMDPEVFGAQLGQETSVTVQIEDQEGGRTTVWEARLVPGTDPVGPEWRTATVAVPPGARAVMLTVEPPMNETPTSIGWAGVTYGPPISRSPEELQQLELVHAADETWVYRTPRASPRAFLVHDAHRVEGLEEAVRYFERSGFRDHRGRLILDDFDPSSEVVVEGSSAEVKLPRTCSGAEHDSARVVEYSPQRVRVRLTTACDAVLVLTDTYTPGWTASVNGSSAPVLPANMAFRAVPVPAGESEVVFRYRPSAVPVGTAISIVTLLGFLTVGGVSARRRKASP